MSTWGGKASRNFTFVVHSYQKNTLACDVSLGSARWEACGCFLSHRVRYLASCTSCGHHLCRLELSGYHVRSLQSVPIENWWLESDISPLTYIAVGPLTAITTKTKTDLPQPVESTISKLSAHHSSTDNTGWNSTVEFLRNYALMQIRCCGWPQQFGIPAEPIAVPHKIRQDGSLDRSTYIAREYDASGCTFLDKHQPNATGAVVAQPPIHSLTDSYCYFTRIRLGITFVRVRPWIRPAHWCDLCMSSFPQQRITVSQWVDGVRLG
jgi:hypothetical protein